MTGETLENSHQHATTNIGIDIGKIVSKKAWSQLSHQARNQLGTLEGPTFFKLCPIVSNYMPSTFFQGK